MHRVILFSEPITINGETLYGKLFSGETEVSIWANACDEVRELVLREQWTGQQGDDFRNQEGWGLVKHKDGSESWSFDKNKYTNNRYLWAPDQFVEKCWTPPMYIVLISKWVPLRMSDCNSEDYIINRVFYDSVVEADTNDTMWIPLNEPEELQV